MSGFPNIPVQARAIGAERLSVFGLGHFGLAGRLTVLSERRSIGRNGGLVAGLAIRLQLLPILPALLSRLPEGLTILLSGLGILPKVLPVLLDVPGVLLEFLLVLLNPLLVLPDILPQYRSIVP